jgi:AraC-like DNA-binding protein/mannose-6-phosphate isomerase-like protein (cupin superfamily)
MADTAKPVPFAPSRRHPLRVRARAVPAEESFDWHSHPWAQVAYAARGVIRVSVGGRTWVVPPTRAIWIPPHTAHRVEALEDTQLRTLYIEATRAPLPLEECKVIEVSPLLALLIGELSAERTAATVATRQRLLTELILHEIGRAESLPLAIPVPNDKRLVALCERLIHEPSLPLGLKALAQQVGASERTMGRLFQRELNMSFNQWRTQLRLMHAVSLAATDRSFASIAEALGYQSQSAFSAMFRRRFGKSPSAFFRRD